MSWNPETGQGLDEYNVPPGVCVTHLRFVPCRRDPADCVYSEDPADVERVRAYQEGDGA